MGHGESAQIASSIMPSVEIGMIAFVLFAIEIGVRWHFGRIEAPAILRIFPAWLFTVTCSWALAVSFVPIWFAHEVLIRWPGFESNLSGNAWPAVWMLGLLLVLCVICLHIEAATGKRTRVMNEVRRVAYTALNPARNR